MDEPLTELAAYFRRDTRLPDQELVRLTATARADGSRWDDIAAACGIKTYNDLAGGSIELPARPVRMTVGAATSSRT
jgi:hypothetical protein